MKCYFHEDSNAVATCQGCGKSLCKLCASKSNPCLCDECLELETISAEQMRKQISKDALIDANSEFVGAIVKGTIAAVVFTLVLNAINGTPTPIAMSAMFFFIPFGWALITYFEQWLPGFFMGGIVFLFYIALKLAFSILLGIPCFFYQIVRYIYKLIKK